MISKKTYIQLLLSLSVIILILLVYLNYFRVPTNNEIIANKEKKNNQMYNTPENLISDIFYFSEDKRGNKYEIVAKNGTLSQKSRNNILMNEVSAVIYLNSGEKIFIVSETAEYNNNNNDTFFKGSVKLKYNEHVVKAKNLDLSFDSNKASLYEKVNYISELSNLMADRVEIDFLNMNTKILMNNSDENVLVKKLVRNGDN